MRIAFAYGRYSLGGKTLVPPFTNSALTGSEWSCLSFAREFARNGHQVSLYLPRKRPFDIPEAPSWEGVRLRELSFLKSEPCDVCVAWNEPDILSCLNPAKTLRIVNQQLNDFWYAAPDYDRWVDVYTSPSEAHLIHLRDQTPSPHKWTVLPNGCDPDLYTPAKVPGRVIYASSPDRGLHHLLSMWTEIRSAVPEAHLRIFYDLNPFLALADLMPNQIQPRHEESRNRAISVKGMLPTLLEMGVEVVGPVSREQMVKEMNEAVVLAYPCDPYTWTEGFSVTVMEACAAGCVPVITNADALGEIYGEVCPMVNRYRVNSIDHFEFVEEVVNALLDDEDKRTKQCELRREFARQYSWVKCAERLESIIRSAVGGGEEVIQRKKVPVPV